MLALTYAALLVNPSPLFAYSLHEAPFNVYSDRPIPDEMRDVLAAARQKLAKTPLLFPSDEFHIYVSNDRWRRRLVNPVSAAAFGASYPGLNTIHLGRSDAAADVSWADGSPRATRPLSAVLTHECVHQVVRRRLGLVRSRLLPRWIDEGYAEVIAGGATLPIDEAAAMVVEGRGDSSHGFRYATYRLAVEQALRDPAMTPSRLLSAGHDFEALLRAAAHRRTAE